MDINYENVLQLWRMVDAMFMATNQYLDKFPRFNARSTKELDNFQEAYYKFMGATNRLHDYAKTLPF